MYGINLCLILSLEYEFLTICLKSYILRKTCGFAQIAQKNCAKLKFRFMRNTRKKNISGFAQIAQNSLRFMRKNSAKVRKKNLHEIAQILRKRFSHLNKFKLLHLYLYLYLCV